MKEAKAKIRKCSAFELALIKFTQRIRAQTLSNILHTVILQCNLKPFFFLSCSVVLYALFKQWHLTKWSLRKKEKKKKYEERKYWKTDGIYWTMLNKCWMWLRPGIDLTSEERTYVGWLHWSAGGLRSTVSSWAHSSQHLSVLRRQKQAGTAWRWQNSQNQTRER